MNKPVDLTKNMEFDIYLDAAIKAARSAGTILMNGLDRRIKVEYKGRINLVTEIDRASQKCILNTLHSSFPDHEFLAEEEESQSLPTAKRDKTGDGEYLWVIDPLDGTTNYTHGYRCFAISIALMIRQEITVGLVYDPWCDELFTAIRGRGAYLNGNPVCVSEEDDLERSLLVTGFPYDIREGKVTNLGLFNHLILKAQAIRRDGSAALDMAYVAAGRFDGFWELKLHPWDVAAGALIIEEAGGMISTFAGETFHITSHDVLATNGKIHRALMQAISEVPQDAW